MTPSQQSELNQHNPIAWPRGWSRIWPLVITLAAGGICYGLFLRRGVWFSVVSYNLSPAERVLMGEVPYRDFLYNYTPGVLWLNAGLMKLFGTTILTTRIGVLIFRLATLVALYSVARRVTSPWAALVPVALMLAWLDHKYILGTYPTQYGLLFAFLALLSLLRYDDSEKSVWLWCGGVFVGVVFVFKYNVGIVLLGALSAAIGYRELLLAEGLSLWPQRILLCLRRLLIYWAGFALVFALLAAILSYQGAFAAMLDHFIHHATAYSDERAIPLPSPKLAGYWLAILFVLAGGGIAVSRYAIRLLKWYLSLAAALLIALLLIPGLTLWQEDSAMAFVAYLLPLLVLFISGYLLAQVKRYRKGHLNRLEFWRKTGHIVILTLFASAIFSEVYPRADAFHLVRVFPPIFLLVAVLLYRMLPVMRDYFHRQGVAHHQMAIECVALPALFLCMAGIQQTWAPQFDAGRQFVERVPLTLKRAQGIMVSEEQAKVIESLSQLIEENSTPQDSMFSFSQWGAAFNFLTGRRNPSRFVWWRAVGITDEERLAAVRLIDDRVPKLILLQIQFRDQRILNSVHAYYDQVGYVDGVLVYVRR